MKRTVHLVLLLAVLATFSGAALAAHRAVAHADHDHPRVAGDADCAVCHSLASRAVEPPPLVAPLFALDPLVALTPADDSPAPVRLTSHARPRAPPTH